jgi:hypothetical protein
MARKMAEIKPSLGSFKLSPTLTSHILGTELDENDDTVVLHRVNDEPRIRKARLRQNRRGEHYFMFKGERMYLADYQPPKSHITSRRIYRYH